MANHKVIDHFTTGTYIQKGKDGQQSPLSIYAYYTFPYRHTGVKIVFVNVKCSICAKGLTITFRSEDLEGVCRSEHQIPFYQIEIRYIGRMLKLTYNSDSHTIQSSDLLENR